MNGKAIFLILISFLAVFLEPRFLQAQSDERLVQGALNVPAPLQPWVRWVLDRDETALCPLLGTDRVCSWSGTLSLEASDKGAIFEQTVFLAKRAKVSIPGGGDIFPAEVKVGGAFAAVSALEGRPVVSLPAGKHLIQGSFRWEELPQSLMLPEDIGLVTLRLGGVLIEQPRINDNAELWLQDEGTQADHRSAEEDSLRIAVTRKVRDGLPFGLSTQIELRVGGKAREINLGNILPSQFLPVQTESPLIHSFDKDQQLRVQLRPGVFTLSIEAIAAAPPETLVAPTSSLAEWPVDEFWAWEADETLRSVTITGVTGIDPARTPLPDAWKSFPAYSLTKGATMKFEERRRGEQDLPPNQLSLRRQLWLDLDGGGYTVQDNLSGKMFQDWRLNMNSPAQLSRVEVSGEAQLITKNKEQKAGVELRSSDLALRAVSRLEGMRAKFPAVSWDVDVNSLQASIMLPPGWQVLEIFGVDNAPGTWLSSWSLWDLFFLVLIAIVVAKLKSLPLGLVTFLALGLSHQVPEAPRYIWLHVIASFALYRVLSPGRVRKIAQWYLLTACGFVAVLLLSFAIDQVRSGLFPQLGSQPVLSLSTLWDIFRGILLVSAVVVGVVLAISAIVSLFKAEFRKLFRAILGVFACFIVTSLVFALPSVSPTYFSAPVQNFGNSADRAEYEQQSMPQDYAPQASSAVQMDEGVAVFNEESLGARKSKSLSSGYGGKLASNSFERQQLLQVDAKAVVQTGVGVPSWNWKTWSLSWNGPVERGREVELLLISPRLNLVLSVLRVLFFALLLLSFLREAFSEVTLERLRGVSQLVLLGALVSTSILVLGSTAQAQDARAFPDEKMLQELQTRLRANQCSSDCLTANHLKLSVLEASAQKFTLQVEARVSSDGDSAWPVPGPLSEYSPKSVTIDGVITDDLRRDEAGFLWVKIPTGVHQVKAQGDLIRSGSVTLQFGLIPQHVQLTAPGWTVDGLSPTGSVGENLQLLRQAEAAASDAKTSPQAPADAPLPEWYRVTRELTLGQPWVVLTTVERLGAAERSHLMRLPILPGESVTDETKKVDNGAVQVNFARGEKSVSWTSTFREEPKFELKAPTGTSITEDWNLRCASIWRCSFEGIRPVSTLTNGESYVHWRPWPGEQVSIEVSKPLGVDGLTETLDSAQLVWSPGTGLLHGSLKVRVRSSQGGFRTLMLPEGALVQEVQVNGSAKNLMPKGRALELPLSPGEQTFLVNWQQPWEFSFHTQLPTVEVGGTAYNVTVSSSVPGKLWLLWATGPQWGPAILFWGALIIVVGFGLLVGYKKVPPLSTFEWVLLGLGTATLHPAVLLVPVVWSVILAKRKQAPFAEPKWFNATQVCSVLLSVIVLGLLFASLYSGLIVDPDMGVRGQGSSTRYLQWYVDRSGSQLPSPQIYWAPMWVYRAFMLAWSTWLVFLVMRWVRWAWGCLAEDGWWKRG